jgi:hypothetical protein
MTELKFYRVGVIGGIPTQEWSYRKVFVGVGGSIPVWRITNYKTGFNESTYRSKYYFDWKEVVEVLSKWEPKPTFDVLFQMRLNSSKIWTHHKRMTTNEKMGGDIGGGDFESSGNTGNGTESQAAI